MKLLAGPAKIIFGKTAVKNAIALLNFTFQVQNASLAVLAAKTANPLKIAANV